MSRLGILSGIGASAGLHMATRLIEVAQQRGAKSDADFPDFLLYNLPSKATDARGIAHAQLALEELSFAIERFNGWGCDYLLLACNTIHYYLRELRDRFRGSIINMVDLASQAVQPASIVGVICSVSTRESGIYSRAIGAHNPGVQVIYPVDLSQDFVNIAIQAAIEGKHPQTFWKGLHAVARGLQDQGADWVILGCTELPLCLKGHPLNEFVVDAGELAVREAFRLLNGGSPCSST